MGNGNTEMRSMFSYGLLVMTVTHTLTHVFQRIHLALFPTIRDEFSLSLQQLGVIAAVPFLCQALLAIPMGLLSDRFGSKKMILISLSVATVGSLVASYTINPLMLTVAISLIYINMTIYHPAAYSFTSRLFGPRDRSKVLGIHGAGGTLGMSIGPLSLGILMGFFAFGWRKVYLFWFVPTILGIISVLFIRAEPREDVHVEPSSKAESNTKEEKMFSMSFIVFLLSLAMRSMGSQMFNSFLAVFLVDVKGLGQNLVSLILGSSLLVGPIAAPIGGFLAFRFGEKRWLVTVLALAYASLGLAISLPGVAGFVIFYVIYGFFLFLGMAPNSAIIAHLSPSRRRGLGYTLYFLPGSIMGAIAPIIAAQIAGAFGLTSIFFASLAVLATGLAVLKFGVKY